MVGLMYPRTTCPANKSDLRFVEYCSGCHAQKRLAMLGKESGGVEGRTVLGMLSAFAAVNLLD